MNCREAQPQIFAERDGSLDNHQLTALNGHLAQCDACRRIRENLTAALTTWRADAASVRVPDAEREWHAVRRRIRGGAESGAERVLRPRRNLFTWIAVPLGAAAAVAVALFLLPSSTSHVASSPPVQTAHAAGSVEASGNSATMVFVDEKEGWLFVVADNTGIKTG